MAGNPEGKVAPSALAITAHMAKQRKKGRPTYQDNHLKAPTHQADSVGLELVRAVRGSRCLWSAWCEQQR